MCGLTSRRNGVLTSFTSQRQTHHGLNHHNNDNTAYNIHVIFNFTPRRQNVKRHINRDVTLNMRETLKEKNLSNASLTSVPPYILMRC